MRLKVILIGLLLALWTSSDAFAQCSGNPAAGRICANVGATPTIPGWATATDVLDRNFGAPSVQGTILNRGASLWAATPTPTLGLNGTAGGSLQFRGSTSGGATITVPAAAGTVNFRLPPTNGTVNQVLITDGSGNTSWTNAGAGTVSSVGLAMPGIFSISGSPVTGAGTLTATLANQSANLVWAGPGTGAAAAPTFRALVGADLPNPSASTLGGVQSFAAVSSQWIRQISTSGVSTASQPAFTDISGSLDPAQCPNPGASSIGCVQSFAAVSSQWIRQISTAGIVTASQPTFSDISGSLLLAQFPAIASNTFLGNITGGAAVPTAVSASSILDTIGATRGQVLYRGAAGWSVLAPTTAGFVLSTNGAGADPSWIATAGTGTVQTITAGAGITLSSGATCTVSCTLGLSAVADLRVMANISGGSAAPVANTMTGTLDATLGSTQGNIAFRNATIWTVLAPGTSGQYLQTTGAGGNVQWAAAANSVGGITGAVGVANGIEASGSNIQISAARRTLPTVTTLTATATYTTPANTLWLEVYYCGGGGGGHGVSSGANNFAVGSNGVASSFNSVNANPGLGATGTSITTGVPGLGGTGGTGSATRRYAGQPGGGPLFTSAGATTGASGMGGGNFLNGGTVGVALSTAVGNSAASNSGAGGSGAVNTGGTNNQMGTGGGGAECVYLIINSPSATYAWVQGTGGAGGISTTNGGAGGTGGGYVVEHYGT